MVTFRQSLIILMAGSLMGVLIASFYLPTWSGIFLLLLIALGILAILFLRSNQTKSAWILALFLVALSFGLIRFSLIPPVVDSRLDKLIGSEVGLSGRVVSEPEHLENINRFVFAPTDFKTRILVSIPIHETVAYDDQLVVTGKLSHPENFLTDTNREFDYVNYLKVRRIGYRLDFAQISDQVVGKSFWLKSLWQVKGFFVQRLELMLPEPESSLASGILLGLKESLGKEWSQAFQTAGVTHIIVLSGYNITIVADFLLKLLMFLPLRLALFSGGLGVILFAILVGGGATVLRASIMALFVLWARLIGRLYQVSIGLFLALFLMVMYNPLLLVFDPGFQLSFLATIGLIYVSPIIKTYLTKITERYGLRELVASTLSAQLFVAPWLLYKMGGLSLIALPVNLLILPVVPLAMLFSFVTGLLAMISPILAWPVAYLAYLCLAYIFQIVSLVATWPMFSLSNQTVSLVLMTLVYSGYSIFILTFYCRRRASEIRK